MPPGNTPNPLKHKAIPTLASFFQKTKFKRHHAHYMRHMRHLSNLIKTDASSHKRTQIRDKPLHARHLTWPPTC